MNTDSIRQPAVTVPLARRRSVAAIAALPATAWTIALGSALGFTADGLAASAILGGCAYGLAVFGLSADADWSEPV